MSRRKWLVMAVVALIVASVTVATVLPALADDPKPPGPQAGAAQQFLDKVAKILGVQSDKLTAALKQATQETIDEAVKAGKLTAEAAQKLKDRVEQGLGSLPMLFGRGWMPFADKSHRPQVPQDKTQAPGLGMLEKSARLVWSEWEAAAKALGMTSAELMTEVRAGKSLAEIAAAKNVKLDDLKAAMVKDATEKANAAVKDGKLTQAQADKLLEGIKTGIDKVVECKPCGIAPFGKNIPMPKMQMRPWGQRGS